MTTVQFAEARRTSVFLQPAAGERAYPATVRPSGWSFYQGKASLEVARYGGHTRIRDTGSDTAIQVSAADPAKGDQARDTLSIWMPSGELSLEALPDGALSRRSLHGSGAERARIDAVGPAKVGRRTYSLTVGTFRCKVVNDGGRLTVSEDHGRAGKSPGDWSMQRAGAAQTEFRVIDRAGRDVAIVQEDSDRVSDEIAIDIRGLLSIGDESQALSMYREARTHGNEYLQAESPEHRRSEAYAWKLEEGLFSALVYRDGSDAQTSALLLKELGFSEGAAKALCEERPYRLDLFGADRVGQVSNLEVLFQLRDADPIPYGGRVQLHDMRNWMNAWDEKGRLDELIHDARQVYELQGGKIEAYESEGYGPLNLDGEPATARQFNDKYYLYLP